ncbi:MAG: NAD(P)/FAD-dependent oxidoreductase [Frankia sp.]|nr:NAD(P)/FAD-dependent oxidoreductase [Frankia sp.]
MPAAAPAGAAVAGGDELPEHADIVVIGGGHNGLACAAYLARAGRSVAVLEARAQAGGCASTVDAIGARVNICNCDHTMIRASGVIEDLDLPAHGLRYLEVDPMLIAVGWADEPVFVQWRSVERTLAGLARAGTEVAQAYQRYLRVAMPAARLVLAVQCGRPTTPSIVATVVARQRLRGARVLLDWPRRSLVDVLSSFGLPPWMIAAAHTIGPAVWGLPPDAPGTGLGALGLAIRHLVGVGRPVGGSGALPAALAACVRAHGGRVVTNALVAGVEVDGGRVRAVRLADGRRVSAGAVVNATDPRTLLVDWLADVPAASRLRARWAASPADDGYESKLDAVVAADAAGGVPVPRAVAELGEDVLPRSAYNIPTMVVSPTPEQQIAGGAQLRDGLVTDPPMLLVNTPSVLDETMRPAPDAHVLSLEVLWTPWALRGGWDDRSIALGWLRRYASLCADGGDGLLASVRAWRAMTPPDYEREFHLRRGYVPSFPDGVMAALLGRRRELSRYRTPLPNLFLTGGATFPGAGVWGASGRNAAATVLAAR